MSQLQRAEEDEIENFQASIQEETDHTPKQDMLIIIGAWNTKCRKQNRIKSCWKFGPGA